MTAASTATREVVLPATSGRVPLASDRVAID